LTEECYYLWILFSHEVQRTAKHLIEEDTFYNINALRQGYTHGYAVASSVCCICGLGLEDDTMQGHKRNTMENSNGSTSKVASRGPNGFSIFSCGHAAHSVCIADGGSNKEGKGFLGCPVCSLKVKSSTSPYLANKATGKGEDEANIGSTSTSLGTVADYSVGTSVKSNHRAPEVSRVRDSLHLFSCIRDSLLLTCKFSYAYGAHPLLSADRSGYTDFLGLFQLALLKQLQQGKQLSDLGPSLKLHLAPPKKNRLRRASVPESSATSRSRPVQKISMSLRR